MGGLVGDGAGGGLGGEPAEGGKGGGAGDDFDAGRLRFVGGLVAVAGVSIEAHGFARDEQGRRGAGEAGEVVNVGEVRNEEGRETGPGELTPQASDAERMIHPPRYITGRVGAGTQRAGEEALVGGLDGFFLAGRDFGLRHGGGLVGLLVHPVVEARALEAPAIAELEGGDEGLGGVFIEGVGGDAEVVGGLADVHDLTEFWYEQVGLGGLAHGDSERWIGCGRV